MDVPAAELGFYEWDGRTIKAHRADIRRYFGFRECSVADADKAAEWLAANVCEKERQVNQVREKLLAHLRGEQIEPPAGTGSALEEQRNGEWRYLEFLQVTSLITADIFMREIPGGTRAGHRSRPVDLPEHRY